MNDLLCPTTPSTAIRVLDDKRHGVIVHGLKEHVVMSPAQVSALIAAGEAHRHVGATAANDQSSRSHTIFRMIIESRLKDGGGVSGRGGASAGATTTTTTTRVSMLNLVDLAGSESARLANYAAGSGGGGGIMTRSGSGLGAVGGGMGGGGSRQKEGGFINKSLLTLGHVVSKLVEIQNARDRSDSSGAAASAAAQQHVPYRDSKVGGWAFARRGTIGATTRRGRRGVASPLATKRTTQSDG